MGDIPFWFCVVIALVMMGVGHDLVRRHHGRFALLILLLTMGTPNVGLWIWSYTKHADLIGPYNFFAVTGLLVGVIGSVLIFGPQREHA